MKRSNFKKSLFYTHLAMAGITSLFSISFFFFNDSIVSESLAKSTGLHVSHEFTGGTITAEYMEEIDASRELKRYVVYTPVYNAPWQQNPEYWQLEQSYGTDIKNLGEISVQVDSPNAGTYILHIDGNCPENSILTDREGKFICALETYVSRDGRTVKTRIPLEQKQLQKFYTEEKTTHYIKASNIQQTALEVNMKEKKVETNSITSRIEEYRAPYIQLEKEKTEGTILELESLESKSNPAATTPVSEEDAEFEKAYHLFLANDAVAAEKAFKAIIDRDGNNVKAMAYYGSSLAKHGGQVNPFTGMNLVNKAYVWLDKAVALSEGTEFHFEALMNRAEVSASVPNTVFHKAQTGAEDFEKAARLFEERLSSQAVATPSANGQVTPDTIVSPRDIILDRYLWASAADCWLKCGDQLQASICLKNAERFCGK